MIADVAPSAADIERHAASAWPAAITREAAGGWLLRATPGLDRARSNNALTPCRVLAASEIDPAIAIVEAFAAEHGIRAGVQVSPESLHRELDAELAFRGYEPQWPVSVLVADTPSIAATEPLAVDDYASAAWLAAWSRAEGRDQASVAAHEQTVFALLGGRARFAQLEGAVALAVHGDGLCAIFCLAVPSTERRRGLAQRLIRGLACERHVYVQVDRSNLAAATLYARLGFGRAYDYRHRVQSL
jgi:ribosomal protein S18 acetylase RimI-like enzyme